MVTPCNHVKPNISVRPISIDVDNIRLENGLTLLLRPIRLAAVVTEEVLLVTSRQTADEYTTTTRVYPFDVGTLTVDELIGLVQSKIEPSSWSDAGGRGSISGIDGGLVVRQPKRLHDELEAFLGQLMRHSRRVSRN